MTTWAHRTSPRAGLSPAGSVRLRAARRVGGRRRAPHGNADWRRFPPAPLSTGRWVLPSPAASERISAAAFPCSQRQRAHRPALVSPLSAGLACRLRRRRRTRPWGTQPDRHCASARDSPLRALRQAFPDSGGHACPEALRSSEVVLSSPSSLLRPQPPVSTPPDDFPCLRLYAGSLPYGRVLAGVETFPALRHRSFARCHRPYAGEPCGCTYPIPSPQTLAFAFLRQARRSQHHSWL